MPLPLQSKNKFSMIIKMKDNLTGIERKILAVLQQGFPKSQMPYKDMAARIGIETEQLLAILEDWQKQGRIRRIGAVVNHFKVGFGVSAMVVWQVPRQRIDQVGRILAGFDEISHAYERDTGEDWPYNFYTMVHATDAENLCEVVECMSRACGVREYRVLTTERELKKVPPTYIK